MQNLKILISGAGIAGLTCAGLLAKQGVTPTLIERNTESEFYGSGYMLGLLPLGGRVLNQLDLNDEYLAVSTKMTAYKIFNGKGVSINSFPLDFINENYGHYGGISRSDLVRILLKSYPGNIEFKKEIRKLTRLKNQVDVKFSDDTTCIFDLVIIAEGLYSNSRQLILKESEYNYYETNWGGWVCWVDEKPDGKYKEFWGDGKFFGLYPAGDKTGAFLGGPVNLIQEKGKKNFINDFSARLVSEQTVAHNALEKLKNEQNSFFWNFQDCNSDTWSKGNIILLGDAATGFLPTAGVGASMAMDSASALVDELSRADKDHINYAFKLYTKRQKHRAEKAQSDSRKLGKFMFINSVLKTSIRNKIFRFYTLERMLSDLSGILEGE